MQTPFPSGRAAPEDADPGRGHADVIDAQHEALEAVKRQLAGELALAELFSNRTAAAS